LCLCIFFLFIDKLIIFTVLMKVRVEFRVKFLSDHIFIFLVNVLIPNFFVDLRQYLFVLVIGVRCGSCLVIFRGDIYFSRWFFYHRKIDTVIWLFENTRALVDFPKKIVRIFGKFSLNPIFITETKVRVIKNIFVEVNYSNSWYSPATSVLYVHSYNILSPNKKSLLKN